MQIETATSGDAKEIALDVAIGLVGGLAGTYVMTKLMPHMAKLEREEARKKAAEVSSESSVMVLARRIADFLEIEMSEEALGRLANAIHYTYGTAWGGAFALLHRRIPKIMRYGALPFGLLFYALSDEAMPATLKLSPPPTRYPLDSHLHGLAGHLVWTFAADAVYHGLRKAAA